MSTLGWSLTGAGIWVFVSLTIPLVIALFERPMSKEDAHLTVGLSWLWPVLGPLMGLALMVVGIITGVTWLGKQYAALIMGEQPEKEEKAVEGKVVT